MSQFESTLQYFKTRLLTGKLALLVSLLTLASFAGASGVTLQESVIRFALLSGLVVWFRLWDDLADREADRHMHPERILVQAQSLTPFYMLWAALLITNGIAVWEVSGDLWRMAGLTVTVFTFTAWYALRDRVSKNPVVRSHVVLLKYPLFVWLVAGTVSAERWPVLTCTLVLVFVGLSLYEILHDPKMRANHSSRVVLVFGLFLFALALGGVTIFSVGGLL